jgi:hypothetical protein
MQDDIPRWNRGEERSASGASSASGLSIGFSAMKLALGRFLRRMFMPYDRAAVR